MHLSTSIFCPPFSGSRTFSLNKAQASPSSAKSGRCQHSWFSSVRLNIFTNEQSTKFGVSAPSFRFQAIVLINKSNSLSEIQAVLAHEIGHLALNHFSTRLVNSQNLSNYSKLATFAGIALSVNGKLNTNSALGLMIGSNDLAKKSSLQFSRIQEQQADKFALDQLIKNKISLNGFETLLINLANEEFNNSNTQTSYYRSHPFSKQRLEQVKKYKSRFQKISFSEQSISINGN